jgi:hypothetical protein
MTHPSNQEDDPICHPDAGRILGLGLRASVMIFFLDCTGRGRGCGVYSRIIIGILDFHRFALRFLSGGRNDMERLFLLSDGKGAAYFEDQEFSPITSANNLFS